MQRNFQQIVNECAVAVAMCYDHYCDEGLSEEGLTAVRKALYCVLPTQESGIAFRECGEVFDFRDLVAADRKSEVPSPRGFQLYETGYYEGLPCTCPVSCTSSCKGECGCEACSCAYSDYLSSPE